MAKSHTESVLTVGEVADLWGISRRTVHRYIAAGLLKAIKLPGGDYRISRSDLDAALADA
ncbi:helix-turn-helix domain-containing protein [Mycobacterium sp. CBMA293]|uniref:helix-turn-helix domain-containing protein n=1 Tax=unclassified Mycolicibacterium TaxID=2636767 RepID=UPI0012DDBF18|nr:MULTISPECIES: helix-turn-helix domain-containing protein [unclassified Mycolicibacterium]MUL50166.1 helix-turn-helix domain-containing protein [Mycolicibacterium sp. CBMA 360]MUL61914.1 helix-turn-helix domain-containing protein [Mycolicibacterium sp. CBMA 335]MUL68987.1 helix-turn-helix domain-containing protein [Mycolicibacterium sp. CBMA 311]MUL92796.1 helix-turn-helix domain-containing protein [Mycolicibacterium sp. CBMA 230]MUM08762.1 hypothetical protein [Mycolicibacterium sp. CBMA 21